MKNYLAILGYKVRDAVTGQEGIATTVGFDLYGCVQVIVNPGNDKDGKPKDMQWFDHKRLTILDKTPVMAQPTFEDVPGGDVRNPVM